MEGVITTKDGELEIKVAADQAMALRENLKGFMLAGDLRNLALIQVHDNIFTIRLRLSEKGDYGLYLHGDQDETADELPNLLNYIIKVENDTDAKPFPKLHENGLGKGYLAKRLGVKAKSHKVGTIGTGDGKIKIDFKVPSNFELFAELTHNELGHDELAECQKVENGQHSAHVILTLPEAGEYGLNCYVMEKSDPNQVYQIQTYLITSTQADSIPMVRRGSSEEIRCVPLPVSVKGNTAIIPVPAGKLARTTELLHRNAQDKISPNAVKVERVGDDDVYTVNLGKKDGEFKFEVFEYDDNNMLKQVAEFMVHKGVDRPDEDQADKIAAEELERVMKVKAPLSKYD